MAKEKNKNQNLAEYGLVGFIILLLIPLVYFLLTKVYLHNIFSENTGLYFYSALVQSNAAIFSILAIFLIFRMQYINSRISSIRSELTNINNTIAESVREYFAKNSEERKIFINKYEGDKNIGLLYQRADHFLDSKQRIKSRLKIPFIFLFLVILIQAILLLLASSIHDSGYVLEISFFTFTLIVQV